MLLTEKIKTLVNQALGTQVDLITYRQPGGYQSNRLYDVWLNGRHLIAKEYLKPDEFLDAPRRDFNCMQRLADLNIAPKPVFYDPNLGPLVIYAYLEGEIWPRKRPSPQMLAQLVETWLILHSLSTADLWLARSMEQAAQGVAMQCVEIFQTYAAWTAVQFPSGKACATHCLNLLPKLFDAVEQLSLLNPTLCFCQSDTRFANILQRPSGKLALIDWEDGGLGDPAFDLANFLVAPNEEDLLGMQEWEGLLRPYLKNHHKPDPTFELRMQHYLTIITIFWLALFLKGGMHKHQTNTLKNWQIHDLPANYRLQRYLTHAISQQNTNFQSQLAGFNDLQFFPVSPRTNIR